MCAFLGAGLQLQEKQNGSFEMKFHYLKLTGGISRCIYNPFAALNLWS